jgi:hypothetical protein
MELFPLLFYPFFWSRYQKTPLKLVRGNYWHLDTKKTAAIGGLIKKFILGKNPNQALPRIYSEIHLTDLLVKVRAFGSFSNTDFIVCRNYSTIYLIMSIIALQFHHVQGL